MAFQCFGSLQNLILILRSAQLGYSNKFPGQVIFFQLKHNASWFSDESYK